MVSQYEEAVEHDLRTMAESSGFVCVKAKALIDGDEKNARFGHVVSVSLRLAPDSPDRRIRGTIPKSGRLNQWNLWNGSAWNSAAGAQRCRRKPEKEIRPQPVQKQERPPER